MTELNKDSFMPVPTHIFDPPLNIIRSSHAVLDVTNLETSRDFYENTIGLHVEDQDDGGFTCAAAKSISIIRWCCEKR